MYTEIRPDLADRQIVQQVVAQLPWHQNVTLLDKVREDGQRLWYARATIEHGWSRDIRVHQIETGLHERQGRAITNFDTTMEPVCARRFRRRIALST